MTVLGREDKTLFRKIIGIPAMSPGIPVHASLRSNAYAMLKNFSLASPEAPCSLCPSALEWVRMNRLARLKLSILYPSLRRILKKSRNITSEDRNFVGLRIPYPCNHGDLWGSRENAQPEHTGLLALDCARVGDGARFFLTF